MLDVPVAIATTAGVVGLALGAILVFLVLDEKIIYLQNACKAAALKSLRDDREIESLRRHNETLREVVERRGRNRAPIVQATPRGGRHG